jgi:hypothetical protein
MVKVEQINYEVDWKLFKKGFSFFIPCLDPWRSRKHIIKETNRLKYTVVTKVVIEDAVQGIRVWRI